MTYYEHDDEPLLEGGQGRSGEHLEADLRWLGCALLLLCAGGFAYLIAWALDALGVTG